MHITLIHVADELHFSEFSELRPKIDQTNYHPLNSFPIDKGTLTELATTRASALRPMLGGVTKPRQGAGDVITSYLRPVAICQI